MSATVASPCADIVVGLEAHADSLREHGVMSLALFGSRARGEARDDSDLDVLIDYDRKRPFTLYDLVRIERLLANITGLEVHVATRDAFPPAHLERVLRDAVDVL